MLLVIGFFKIQKMMEPMQLSYNQLNLMKDKSYLWFEEKVAKVTGLNGRRSYELGIDSL